LPVDQDTFKRLRQLNGAMVIATGVNERTGAAVWQATREAAMAVFAKSWRRE